MADRGAAMKARAARLTANETTTGIPSGGTFNNGKQAGAKPVGMPFAELKGSTKAQKRLDKFARGGSVKKGKTNINIVIAQPKGDQPTSATMPPMAPPSGPAMMPPPPPAGAAPPGGAPGMGAPGGAPTIVMPPGAGAGPPPPPMPGHAMGGRIGRYKKGGVVGKEMAGKADSTDAVKKELKTSSAKLTRPARAMGGRMNDNDMDDKGGKDDGDGAYKRGGHVKHGAHKAPAKMAPQTNIGRRYKPMGPPPEAVNAMPPDASAGDDMGPPMAPDGPPAFKKGGRMCRASGGAAMTAGRGSGLGRMQAAAKQKRCD